LKNLPALANMVVVVDFLSLAVLLTKPLFELVELWMSSHFLPAICNRSSGIVQMKYPHITTAVRL
jgi:hypothetical protein